MFPYMIDASRALPRPLWMTTVPVDELPDVLRCGYASKHCDNPRTIKKSGGLHRFCAFHRDRANRNQRRVDNRRRMQKSSPKAGANDVMTPCKSSPRSTPQPTPSSSETPSDLRLTEDDLLACFDEIDAISTREAMLNAQDVAILTELLFDADTSALEPIAWVPCPAPALPPRMFVEPLLWSTFEQIVHPCAVSFAVSV